MNNPIHDIMRNEVRKHLLYLDKVLLAASKDPAIKEAVDKAEFYAGLKFGGDEKDGESGLLTHLYETQNDLVNQCEHLEKEIDSLREDAQNFAMAVNNIHKYIEESIANHTYYNQSRWHEIQNTLSKYGEY